jgi:hypothetical protein
MHYLTPGNHNKKYRDVTEQEVEFFAEQGLNKGETAKEIAKIIGCSKFYINRKLWEKKSLCDAFIRGEQKFAVRITKGILEAANV